MFHGGFNDVPWHVMGSEHQQKHRDVHSSSSLRQLFCQSSSSVIMTHTKNMTTAEVMMCKFISMHNLPFLAADHLSSLLPSMFPNSAIATDFACRHTKTITKAFDPQFS